MINGKINLSALVHVVMTKKGKAGNDIEGLFIPIEANHLFKSDKSGNVYLDLVAFPVKEPKDHMTHVVNQSLPKEIRDAMSDEEKRDKPFFGSLNIKDGYDEKSGRVDEQTYDADDGLDPLPF